MKIGIDLDNTIIDYDLVFLEATKLQGIVVPETIVGKLAIREYLKTLPNGELVWQQAQGLAYGKLLLQHAKLFSGVKRFLWRCLARGHHIEIVSHKTQFGHGDKEKIPLREVATEFLTQNDLLSDLAPMIASVNFAETKSEKIEIIENKHFDIFIDDLPEILMSLKGDNQLKTYLFDPAGLSQKSPDGEPIAYREFIDWQQIDHEINGIWTENEVEKLYASLVPRSIEKSEKKPIFEKIAVGGNAAVFKVVRKNQSDHKLKIYPVDAKHDRLFSEYLLTQSYLELRETNVPKPVKIDLSLGVGIFEWIEGRRLEKHSTKEVVDCLNFIKKLHGHRSNHLFKNAPSASAACLSVADVEKQLTLRLSQFGEARSGFPELDQFFKEAFEPTMGHRVDKIKKAFPGIAYITPYKKEELTLSPSDFGFHNMVKRENGESVFLDFEYFGWDDPVKLISDFSFHPGMNLAEEEVGLWLKGAIEIFGENIKVRLESLRPAIGLFWCLILLNDYRSEIWQRRILADPRKIEKKAEILATQLDRAKLLLSKINRL